MMNKVKPIPAGYHTVTPYLTVKNAAQAIAFYQKALGAKEVYRIAGPDGMIGHAEIKIGDSTIMLSDEFPGMGSVSPQSIGGTTMGLHVYVENVDALFNQATAAGAKVLQPLTNQFYGDRSAKLADPFGHIWNISTHIEDIAPDEMKRRAAAAMSGKKQ